MYDLWLSYKPARTVTAQLYLDNTPYSSAFATSEVGGIGEYYANVPSGTAANEYVVVFFDGSTKVVSGVLDWDGTKEIKTADSVINSKVDGDTTLAESLRLANAVLGGKVSGAQTGIETFRDLADTKNRVVSHVDSNGNRTLESYDLT
jgi:hypothetical protein